MNADILFFFRDRMAALPIYQELEEKLREANEKLVDYALSLGVKNAYVQETDSSSRTYIPDFDEFTL